MMTLRGWLEVNSLNIDSYVIMSMTKKLGIDIFGCDGDMDKLRHSLEYGGKQTDNKVTLLIVIFQQQFGLDEDLY